MMNEELKEILELSEEQIKNLSYESAMEKLEVVVNALEEEGTPLEMGLRLYELGTILSRKCGQILDSTEEKMVQLLGTVENPKEENFNPEDDGR